MKNADGIVTIQIGAETKSFDAQIEEVEDQLKELIARYKETKKLKPFDGQEDDLKKFELEIEKTKNKLVDLRKKQEDLDKKNVFGNIGNSIEKVIKKVARWGLAIFGIRSAYNAVRSAISELSSSDDQIATDVEYIRYALANALKPIVETIIKLAYKLLVYTAYIAKAWFGVNLFANSSAKAFQETNKNVKATNKSAKELQKTLTGFDEMNILQQNGDTTVGGGGGGVSIPSVDLSDWENVEIPSWIKWIADNKNTILSFFGDIISIIATVKIASFLGNLTGIFTIMRNMQGLTLFTLIAGLAITLIGIYDTIKNLINWIANPSWETFRGVLEGISLILIGIGTTLAVINASNPIGWISIGIGVVGGLISSIGDWGKKNEKVTETLKDTKKATNELIEAQEKLTSQTKTYTSAVKNQEKTQKELEEAEKKNQMSGEVLFNSVRLGTLEYKNMTDAQREVFDAYVANLEAQEQLKDATDEFTKAQKDANDASGELSGAIYQETKTYDDYFNQLIKGFEEGNVSSETFYRSLDEALKNMDKETRETFFKNLPQNVKDGIKLSDDEMSKYIYLSTTQLNTISKTSKDVFENEIPNQIKNGLDSNKIANIFNSFKNLWNNTLNSLKTNINLTASTSVSKGSGRAKGGVFYPSRLPKLAVGGIINSPGAGVPYNGAYIGERGAEAVVPLTDSQQMALLGEAIGKYITINAQMNNYMNGRLISRELQKVQNDSNFAFNR